MKSVRDHSQARVIKPTGKELASIVAIAHTLLPKPTHTNSPFTLRQKQYSFARTSSYLEMSYYKLNILAIYFEDLTLEKNVTF